MRKHPKQKIKEISQQKNGRIFLTALFLLPVMPIGYKLGEVIESTGFVVMWTTILTAFIWTCIYWALEYNYERKRGDT